MAAPDTHDPGFEEYFEQRSYLEIVEGQFRKNNLAIWGGRIVLFLILIAIFAPFLANDKPLVFSGYRPKLYNEIYDQFVYAHADLAGLGRSGKPLVIPKLYPDGIQQPGLTEAYRQEIARWEAGNPTWKMIQRTSFGTANAPMNKLRGDLVESIKDLDKDRNWARGVTDVKWLQKQKLPDDVAKALEAQVVMCKANLEVAYRFKVRSRRDAVLQQLRMLQREVGRADRQAIKEFMARYTELVTDDIYTKDTKQLVPFDALILKVRERLDPQTVSFVNRVSFPALRQLGYLDLWFIPFVLLWALRGLWSFPLGWRKLGRWTRARRQLITCLVLSTVASFSWWMWVPAFNDTTDYKQGMTDGSLYVAWRVMAPFPYGVNENNTANKYAPPWWRPKPPPTYAPKTVKTRSPKIEAPVWSVAWSPDGERLAAASQAGTVRVIATGFGGARKVEVPGRDAVWAHDSARLATFLGEAVWIRDGYSGKVRRELKGHTAEVLAVAWSPDGRFLVSVGRDKTGRIWDTRSGRALHVLEGHAKAIHAVAWSPAGGRVATAGADHEVRLWDAASGKLVAAGLGHQREVDELAFTLDGMLLASGSRDTTIRLWHGETGLAQGVLKGHTGAVKALAWSPGGRLLASGSWDRTVRLWGRYGAEAVQVLRGHADAVEQVAWSGNGTHLASVSRDETVRLWTEKDHVWQPRAVLSDAPKGVKETFKKDLASLKRDSLKGHVSLALRAKVNGFTKELVRLNKAIKALQAEGKTLDAEGQQRFDLLTQDAPADWMAMVRWAKQAGMRTQARVWLRKVLEQEPDNLDARRAFGHAKVDGKWLEGDTLSEAVGHRLASVCWSGGEGDRLASSSWDGTVQLWRGQGGKGVQDVAGSRALVLLQHDVNHLRNLPQPKSQYTAGLDLLSRHHMGTDGTGRDLLTRMIWGSRISLSIGFVAVGIYVVIGIILGALAGFFGGWVDILISRAIEIVICFPAFFLILTVIAFIGPSIFNIMFVIGVTRWTGVARLVRGEFLRLRSQDFVTAGKALGYSNARIIFRHVLPNALAPVLVAATFGVAAAILIESSLSFLGFGVTVPTPTWGSILSSARESWIYWWITIFPGLAIFLTVTMYNLVGEGIRDAVDPKMRKA